MTAKDLLGILQAVEENFDLSELQIVIRLEDSDDNTHMGGLVSAIVDCGCTDTPALVLDCDQDPVHCPLQEPLT